MEVESRKRRIKPEKKALELKKFSDFISSLPMNLCLRF